MGTAHRTAGAAHWVSDTRDERFSGARHVAIEIVAGRIEIGARRGPDVRIRTTRAETDLLAMPFKAVYVFRPAFIAPLHGIKSRTRMYNIMYAILWPLAYLIPAGRKSTTESVGRAMLNVAKNGFDTKVLESSDINRAAGH